MQERRYLNASATLFMWKESPVPFEGKAEWIPGPLSVILIRNLATVYWLSSQWPNHDIDSAALALQNTIPEDLDMQEIISVFKRYNKCVVYRFCQ